MGSASQPAPPRPATEADLPSILGVIAAAYGKYRSRMDKPPAPLLRDYSLALDSMWVTGNPVIGLISLIQTDDSILIENVAVHPEHQGTGLGRQLMEFAEEHARNRQIRRLWLYTNEVMTENQAIYVHLGYRVTKRLTEDGYRRICMEKILPVS
jgi:ribosomal protein S18 acetylase RimI-like enzyme